MGMKCIYCGSNNVYATDSRWRENQKLVYRSKHCADCHEQFGTYEIPVEQFNRMAEAESSYKRLKKIVGLCGE